MKLCKEGDELSNAKSHTSIQQFDVKQHISWHFVAKCESRTARTGVSSGGKNMVAVNILNLPIKPTVTLTARPTKKKTK